ncbi:PDZ domain-containing protein [Streptomyces sp. NPDC047043]|uniref:PDZ domain-containing protein n=1 Tax=Streptomyces sp. NPDC047043 TaxID=3154497 RepID=UPI0033DA52F4
MEHTALRPKPMPGQDPGRGIRPGAPARRPHAARRRARRLRAVLFALFVGTVLVLSGVGIGTVGATVIGMSKLADLQRHAQVPRPPTPPAPHTPTTSLATPTVPAASPAATLGLEAVDAQKAGALVVGVHVPGPAFAAGLVRGDVLLAFGRTRIDSAADLAHAVAHARPGTGIVLTVRHQSGGYQQLTAIPGVVT